MRFVHAFVFACCALSGAALLTIAAPTAAHAQDADAKQVASVESAVAKLDTRIEALGTGAGSCAVVADVDKAIGAAKKLRTALTALDNEGIYELDAQIKSVKALGAKLGDVKKALDAGDVKAATAACGALATDAESIGGSILSSLTKP